MRNHRHQRHWRGLGRPWSSSSAYGGGGGGADVSRDFLVGLGLGLGLEDRSPLATAPLESSRVSAAIIVTSFLSSLHFRSEKRRRWRWIWTRLKRERGSDFHFRFLELNLSVFVVRQRKTTFLRENFLRLKMGYLGKFVKGREFFEREEWRKV